MSFRATFCFTNPDDVSPPNLSGLAIVYTKKQVCSQAVDCSHYLMTGYPQRCLRQTLTVAGAVSVSDVQTVAGADPELPAHPGAGYEAGTTHTKGLLQIRGVSRLGL
jgi:hypothetical protein